MENIIFWGSSEMDWSKNRMPFKDFCYQIAQEKVKKSKNIFTMIKNLEKAGFKVIPWQGMFEVWTKCYDRACDRCLFTIGGLYR